MVRFPEVKKTTRGLRSPLKRIAVGLALAVPAGLFTMVTGFNTTYVSQEAAKHGIEADAASREWGARMLAAEKAALVDSFAQAFEIPSELATDIHEAALAAEIDPATAFGLVRAESSFRPAAVSPVGAIGLTQLMPSTARWLEPGVTTRDLKEPETNLKIGFKYLKKLIDDYDGNEKLALTAYNRGPGTVNKLIRRGRNPDNGYAEKVLTGSSERHVRLMNAKFGGKRRAS